MKAFYTFAQIEKEEIRGSLMIEEQKGIFELAKI